MDLIAVVHSEKVHRLLIGPRKFSQGDARTRYLLALRALDANENDVKSLAEFVRS
jgi:hypothetical protein